MKVKALFLIVGVALIAAATRHSFSPALAAPAAPAVDAATADMILGATVQIALYEFDEGQGSESGGRGLGTMVRLNGETAIVTHDHWTHLNANLNEVEFRNAGGDLLLTVSADRMRSMIRYRDGGTMVLAAPAELAGLMPVAPAAETATGGDTVWVARRNRAGGGHRVEVVAAYVETLTAEAGRPRLKLRGADGAVVIPGDSGGGIWLNGRLQGNLWSGGFEIRRTWLDRLLGSSRQTETSLIYAALLPGGQSTDVAGASAGSESLTTAAGFQAP